MSKKLVYDDGRYFDPSVHTKEEPQRELRRITRYITDHKYWEIFTQKAWCSGTFYNLVRLQDGTMWTDPIDIFQHIRQMMDSFRFYPARQIELGDRCEREDGDAPVYFITDTEARNNFGMNKTDRATFTYINDKNEMETRHMHLVIVPYVKDRVVDGKIVTTRDMGNFIDRTVLGTILKNRDFDSLHEMYIKRVQDITGQLEEIRGQHPFVYDFGDVGFYMADGGEEMLKATECVERSFSYEKLGRLPVPICFNMSRLVILEVPPIDTLDSHDLTMILKVLIRTKSETSIYLDARFNSQYGLDNNEMLKAILRAVNRVSTHKNLYIETVYAQTPMMVNTTMQWGSKLKTYNVLNEGIRGVVMPHVLPDYF